MKDSLLKRIIVAVAAIFAAAVFSAPFTDAANYKYVDEEGVVHFTNKEDSIPEHLLETVEVILIEETIQQSETKQSKLQEAVIPYREQNKTMLIDVLVKGYTEEFLFDTGASTTLVSPALEKKLGLKKIPDSEMVMHTANGEFDTYLVNIDRLRVGSIDLKDVKAAVRDFAQKGARTTGILGMNVLEKYTFTINPKTKTIHLKPL
ncbi:MAG: aspartyl protease family protein [Nitrospinota bacterium]